jgi:hypothetical protein
MRSMSKKKTQQTRTMQDSQKKTNLTARNGFGMSGRYPSR